jgi:hypothetical protein
MTTDDELKPLALRTWPNAKLIRISRPSGRVTVAAIDAHDCIIGQVSGESAEAVRDELQNSLPQGGQAP